jgi:hypothetical protein
MQPMSDISEELRRTSKALIAHSRQLREDTAKLIVQANKLREFAKRAASSADAKRIHSDAAQKRQDDR